MKPKRYIIPIFVPHVGCPNNCVFCNQKRISGQVASQTKESAEEIIKVALERIPDGVKAEIAFYGGSFTAIPPKEQEELLSAAQKYSNGGRLSIRLSTRPDCIDETVLERLKKYGVSTVELGVQSMDEAVLLKSGRGHTAKHVEAAVSQIRSYGFQLILQMMTGLPGDTPEKSILTAKKLAEFKPDGVRIYPTVIIRDTELFDMWERGEYREHSVEEAVELCAKIIDVFESADIPIIRLGLNPTEELSGGAAVGGAYHPAFGELVYSREYLNAVCRLLEEGGYADEIEICVPKGKTSVMVGQKRTNIEALKRKFLLRSIKITEDISKTVPCVKNIAKK